MQLALDLIILFLALIIMLGLSAWREFVASSRQKDIDSGMLQIQTEQARIAAATSYLSDAVKNVTACLEQLTINGETAKEFSMKASIDLAYLKSEFETVVAYRKQAAQQFDHVEGL